MIKTLSAVPKAVINRLTRYYFLLNDLQEKGIKKISSHELAKMMGVTASQMRQDLSYFGEFGQRGFGYRVDELFKQIQYIFNLDTMHPMIIAGAGNLAQALVQYQGFKDRGFTVKAMFDINPRLIGLTVTGVKVMDIDLMKDFIQAEMVKIGAIAVPKANAQSVVDLMIDAGVTALWNFAPVELRVPPSVVVENVNLFGSLLTLSFLQDRIIGEGRLVDEE